MGRGWAWGEREEAERGRRLARARRTASPRRPPRTYDPRGGRRMVTRIVDFAPGGHAKPRGKPPRITVWLNTHTRPCTLNHWPPGPAKSRPTNQWLSGYIRKGDGVLKEPTVRTTWAVPKVDRTARIARSEKWTASRRPHHRNGRPGFTVRGWTQIFPRMFLLDFWYYGGYHALALVI
jgi:hypothetical protein